jgi:hypothetical protein
VAELKTVSASLAKKRQERSQSPRIRLELGRQLEQHWTRFVAENRQSLFEKLKAIDRVLRQSFPVGDKLRRFPSEKKAGSGLISPTFDGSGGGRPVEDAIQFRGFELARVIFKMMACREPRWKEETAPGPVAPT